MDYILNAFGLNTMMRGGLGHTAVIAPARVTDTGWETWNPP